MNKTAGAIIAGAILAGGAIEIPSIPYDYAHMRCIQRDGTVIVTDISGDAYRALGVKDAPPLPSNCTAGANLGVMLTAAQALDPASYDPSLPVVLTDSVATSTEVVN